MGKRLVRINNKDISGKLKELIGREVNLVLINKNILHGVIIDSPEHTFRIKDMLLKTHYVKFSEVNEVIYDIEAAF
jgi:hypothetical protein